MKVSSLSLCGLLAATLLLQGAPKREITPLQLREYCVTEMSFVDVRTAPCDTITGKKYRVVRNLPDEDIRLKIERDPATWFDWCHGKLFPGNAAEWFKGLTETPFFVPCATQEERRYIVPPSVPASQWFNTLPVEPYLQSLIYDGGNLIERETQQISSQPDNRRLDVRALQADGTYDTLTLVFTATWCMPCKGELLRRQQKFQEGEGTLPIAIYPYGSSPEEVEKQVKELGVTYPVIIDAPPDTFPFETEGYGSWDGALFDQFSISRLPSYRDHPLSASSMVKWDIVPTTPSVRAETYIESE